MKKITLTLAMSLCASGALAQVPDPPERVMVQQLTVKCVFDMPRLFVKWRWDPTTFGYLLHRDGAPLGFARGVNYHIDGQLEENTTYTYTVQAVNMYGFSAHSTAVSGTTGTCPQNPNPPQNLTATAESCDTIKLEWDHPGYTGTARVYSYRLHRVNQSAAPEDWPGPSCKGSYCGILAWTGNAQPVYEWRDEPGARGRLRKQGNVKPGHCYEYAAETYNWHGQLSGPGPWVSVCVPECP